MWSLDYADWWGSPIKWDNFLLKESFKSIIFLYSRDTFNKPCFQLRRGSCSCFCVKKLYILSKAGFDINRLNVWFWKTGLYHHMYVSINHILIWLLEMDQLLSGTYYIFGFLICSFWCLILPNVTSLSSWMSQCQLYELNASSLASSNITVPSECTLSPNLSPSVVEGQREPSKKKQFSEIDMTVFQSWSISLYRKLT